MPGTVPILEDLNDLTEKIDEIFEENVELDEADEIYFNHKYKKQGSKGISNRIRVLTKKIGRSKERLADALEHIPSLFKEKNALKMVLERRNMV